MPEQLSLYLSLALAIPTAATWTVVHEAETHRKDWVWTPRVLAPVVGLVIFKIVIIIIAYVHIVEWCGHIPAFARFAFWILSLAALACERLADKLLEPLAGRGVTSALVALKLYVVQLISADPEGPELVASILEFADLPLSDIQRIQQQILGKSIHDQTVTVIRENGLHALWRVVKSREDKAP